MVLVTIITALTATAMHAIRPTIAYKALSLGGTPFEVGLIAASYYLLAVFFALPMGRLADRFGPERFAVLGLALTTLTSLALAGLDSIAALTLVFVLAGLGQTIVLVTQQTTVANRGGPEGRAQRFGWYTTAASVGQLVGPIIVGLLARDVVISGSGGASASADATGLTLVLLACAACTGVSLLAGIPLALAGEGRPAAAEAPPGMLRSAAQVMRRPGMLRAMLVGTVVVTSLDMLGAYLPVYGEEHGLSVAMVSLLLTVRAGATLVSRIGIGMPLRTLGSRRLLSLGLAVAAVSMLVVAAAPGEWVLLVLMVLFGLGVGIGQPLTMSWVADQAPRAERATAIAIRLTGNRLALLSVPIVMGVIAGSAGIGAMFVAVAAMLAAGAGGAFRAHSLDQPPERRAAPGRPTG